MMKRKIQLEGMSCGHCVAHVKEALETLENTTDNITARIIRIEK